MSLETYRGMTKEEFMGGPWLPVKDLQNLKLFESARLKDVPFEPFIDGYRAKFSKENISVYDGDKLIASLVMFPSGNQTLIVDPAYRGKGIGSELIYQMFIREYITHATATQRTKALQATLEKVWARIQAELAATPPPAPVPDPLDNPADNANTADTTSTTKKTKKAKA